MRRFYSFMVAALAVMAAASCTQELQDAPQNSDKEMATFTAYVDGAETKTVLDGKVSKWESGDAITVLNGTASAEYTTQDAGVKAAFSGKALSGSKFMAVYPAEYEGHEYVAFPADRSVYAHIPVDQPSCEGSYSKNAAVAVAYTEDQTFEFKNAPALLKFTVKGTNVKSVIFYGHNNEAVSGDVEICLDADNEIESVTALETEYTQGEVTETKYLTWAKLWADDEANDWCFTEGITYYLAVVPQVFENGFTLQLEIAGAGVVDVKKLNASKELKPNVIYDAGELEYIPPTIPVSKVYFKPNDNWTQANARFAAYFFTPGDIWVDMTDPDSDGTYECEVPDDYSNVIFCRMNPSSAENNWDNKWNQTSDLSLLDLVPGTEDCYYINPGTWDKDPNGYWGAVGEVIAPPVPGEDAATVVYLSPSSEWKSDNAWFAAYFFGNGDTWVKMTVEGGKYKCDVPAGYTNVIFCRMNPASTETTWDNKWNQTADLVIPSKDKNCYYVNGWDQGSWDAL